MSPGKSLLCPDSYAHAPTPFAVFCCKYPFDLNDETNIRGAHQQPSTSLPSRALLQRPTRTAGPPLMLHVRSAPRAPPSNRFPLPRSRRIRRRGDVAPPRTHRQPVTAITCRRRHTAARRRHLRAGCRPHRAAASYLLRPFDPARVAREVPHWVDAGADRAGPLVWVEGFGNVDWGDRRAERGV